MIAFIKRILEKPFYSNIYSLGMAVFIFGGLQLVFYGESTEEPYVIYLSFAFFGLGFAAWAMPRSLKIWSYKPTRIVVVILHTLVLLISIIPSRELTAKSLNLPPQDFDLTVGILTLLLYLPVWAFVAAIILSAICFSAMVVTVAIHIVELAIGFLIDMTSLVAPIVKDRTEHLRRSINSLISRLLLHSAGALVVVLCLVAFGDFIFRSSSNIERGVRVLAYYADFYHVKNYPGVDDICAEKSTPFRYRLHANGVISYACPKDSFDVEVIIDVVD